MAVLNTYVFISSDLGKNIFINVLFCLFQIAENVSKSF